MYIRALQWFGLYKKLSVEDHLTHIHLRYIIIELENSDVSRSFDTHLECLKNAVNLREIEISILPEHRVWLLSK